MTTTDLKYKRVETALTKAMKLLQTKGWCQETAYNEKGQFCAIGAVNEVILEPPDLKIATTLLKRAIRAGCYPTYQYIQDWNDAKGRTKAQVLKVFRAAIKLAGDAVRA